MSSPVRHLLFIFGTRPEAIKMAPLVRELSGRDGFLVKVAVTAQHREMLDQVIDFFGIRPDYDLNLMKPNQSLFTVTADALKGLEAVLLDAKPDLVFVQGDTTTAFAGALAAYYLKIKVAHVEAGLRSHNKYAPFPEEMNRLLTSQLTDLHLAPTKQAADNLRLENITRNVHVVGNTVIDALFLGLELLNGSREKEIGSYFGNLPVDKKFVLITGHRRESFGMPFEQMCLAVREIAFEFPGVSFIYPVHLNPNVQEPVRRILGGIENIYLIEPLDYPRFIWLMNKSYIVLTDSGGLQEEAPSLGKPVLVMREVTERQEGIDAGTARLVGTSREMITRSLRQLLSDEQEYRNMAKAVNPYGDGTTSKQIATLVEGMLKE